MIHKTIRFAWLAGCTLGVLMLGACVGVEEEEGPQTSIEEAALDGQDPAAGDLSVTLSADTTQFSADESVAVSISFTNTARHPVRLLAWHTAQGELEENLFEVTRDGQPVPYIGPHYKRPAPDKGSFVTVAPGKTLTREVSLSDFYDLSQTGDYTIRYAVELKGHGYKQDVALSSDKVGVWIEGRADQNPKAAGDGTTSLTSSVSFTKCTASQQTTVLDALNAAGTMADGAVNYLNGASSATPRYTTWFGSYSASGWDTAESHFTAIKDAFDTKSLTFNCGCKKQYYAYVYPNSPYVIYLCSVFWQAPLTGTDSKGGTIVHETSHFTVVAGTDDYAYGQTNAKALANSDPSKALFNADSHEYFAENTPNLQ